MVLIHSQMMNKDPSRVDEDQHPGFPDNLAGGGIRLRGRQDAGVRAAFLKQRVPFWGCLKGKTKRKTRSLASSLRKDALKPFGCSFDHTQVRLWGGAYPWVPEWNHYESLSYSRLSYGFNFWQMMAT